MHTPDLVEHFFRHEYGKLVATLSRRLGVAQLQAIEDAAQGALMAALQSWPLSGVPNNPSAWLFRVAHNQVTSELRAQVRQRGLLVHHGSDASLPTMAADEAGPYFDAEVQDDLLRMLFVCCDEALGHRSQLVLALKTLCGFDVGEIAQRLFSTQANVYKLLARARTRLRETPPRGLAANDSADTELESKHFPARLPRVQEILYLLFTEGYLSSHAEHAIRRELCDEALRLTTLLATHPVGQSPETFALLALLHLHWARMSARQDAAGGLLLLEEQDRSQWDQRHIELGLQWLSRSAEGNTFSRYHAEAGIAAEHCLAPTFAQTRWDRVIACYELLEQTSPSQLHTLNRAVATAELAGPAAGLRLLQDLEPPTWLTSSYSWTAVLADLHARDGNAQAARRYRELALQAAPNAAVKRLLERRLGR